MADTLNYSEFIDKAMRGAVREMLRKVGVTGLPGDHHFYISFSTQHAGVRMSETLRDKYPREITIVLQHQFWDFKVEENFFAVTLSFGGMPEKLVVPFAALTAFADPSVKFGLQFQSFSPLGEEEDELGLPLAFKEEPPASESAEEPGSAEIISLDTFRKK